MSLKIRAFWMHLGVSVGVALLSVLFVFFVWYPSPLDKALSVTDVFLVLMGVDIVIGPLMTLIVFKPGKKYLKLDIFVIVVLQGCAFLYGIGTMFDARPVWLVFNKDRFDLVRAYEVDERKIASAAIRYRSPSWFGPSWVAAKPPEDIAERNVLMFESIASGVDVQHRPDLYYPLEQDADLIKEISFPLEMLTLYNEKSLVIDITGRYPGADAWLPLNTPKLSLVVLLDKKSSAVKAIVDLKPWPQ